MTRILSIISGKGGVGKTVTAVALTAALVERGKSVIVLDGNITTPNISLHLGIPLSPVTLHDVLKGKAKASEAVYSHPSGIRVVPASLSVSALKGANPDRLSAVLLNLLGQAEIIIIDAAAGLGREALAAISVADEILIVTNPDLPSVTDALKTIKLAQEAGTPILGVVLNRVRGHAHELSKKEVHAMVEVPVIATVPEDLAVPRAIASKMPVVRHSPRSRAAREFKKLAAAVLGEQHGQVKKKNWFERLLDYLAG